MSTRGGPRRYGSGAYRPGSRGQQVKSGVLVARVGRDIVLAATGPDAGRGASDPTNILRRSIQEALDPTKAPSKPKTFAEMTESERAEMRRLYAK
jgi:hypothetical protein